MTARVVVEVAPDAAALARQAAEEIARRAEAARAARGAFSIALSGGGTPRALYRLLADEGAPWRARIPWSATQVFFGDERHVPPDDPASNFGMARAALLDHVPIPRGNVHRVRAEDPDADAAARSYEEEIRRTLGAGAGVPRFDVVLLGLGTDGHTASLFPGTDALDVTDRLVAAPWVEAVRSRRITFTYPLLDAARAVLFLVEGEGKAERVREVLEGTAGLPAARVRPAEGEVVWLLDAAAASRLPGMHDRHR